MTLKVGLIGAHGTGKTTLARQIWLDMNSTSLVLSASRDAAYVGWEINKDATALSQLIIMMARIDKERSAFDPEARVQVSDRTPLDSMAYTMYQMLHSWERSPKLDYYRDLSMSITQNHMKSYDLVFYIRPFGGPVENDGVRDPDIEYQLEIDTMIGNLASAMNIPVFEIGLGDITSRAHQMEAIIERALHPQPVPDGNSIGKYGIINHGNV